MPYLFTRGANKGNPLGTTDGTVWDGADYNGTSAGAVPSVALGEALGPGTGFPVELDILRAFSALLRIRRWTWQGTGISYTINTPGEDPITLATPDFEIDFEFPVGEIDVTNQLLFAGESRDPVFIVHADPVPAVGESGDQPGVVFGTRTCQAAANRKAYYPLLTVQSADGSLTSQRVLAITGDAPPNPAIKPLDVSALTCHLQLPGPESYEVVLYDSASFQAGTAWSGALLLKPSTAAGGAFFPYNGEYNAATGRLA